MSSSNPRPNPVGNRSKQEEPRFDLERAYRALIRAYLQRHPIQQPTRSTEGRLHHGE